MGWTISVIASIGSVQRSAINTNHHATPDVIGSLQKLMVRIPLAGASDRLDAGEKQFNDLRIEECTGTGLQLLKDLCLVPSLFNKLCDRTRNIYRKTAVRP